MGIKVLVAGQNGLMNEGIFAILNEEDTITVNIAEPEWEMLVEKLHTFQPDIVLFTVNLFSREIVEQIGLLKKNFPDMKTLLFMSVYDQRYVEHGLIENVDGFALDHAAMDAERLLKKIHHICYHEQFVLSGPIAKSVMRKLLDENEKERLRINLLKKQIQVQQWELDFLYLFFRNYSNKKIAALLGIKEKTIYDYLSRLYKKLGMDGREDLMCFLESVVYHPVKDD